MKTQPDEIDAMIMELEKDTGSASFDNYKTMLNPKIEPKTLPFIVILSFNYVNYIFNLINSHFYTRSIPQPCHKQSIRISHVNISTNSLDTDVEFPWFTKKARI